PAPSLVIRPSLCALCASVVKSDRGKTTLPRLPLERVQIIHQPPRGRKLLENAPALQSAADRLHLRRLVTVPLAAAESVVEDAHQLDHILADVRRRRPSLLIQIQ